MSILLDALKKSEEQRQLGKVPGIHSPGGGAPVRQSRSPRWALLVLVVGSAVAVAWFGWRQFQPPQAGDLSTEETAAVATDKTASSEPAATTQASAAVLRTNRATRSTFIPSFSSDDLAKNAACP